MRDPAASGTKRRREGAWAHLALLAATPLLAIAPLGADKILVMPLAAQSHQATLAWASRSGATIVAAGPLPGSLIVDGSAASLWGPALAHGALLVRAGFSGCGASAEGLR